MPALHKSPSDSHYYVRASHLGRRMTMQLTPEGVRYLTASLGLREGDDFDPDVVEFLYEKKWAYTHGGGLGEEVVGLGDRGEVSGGSSPSKAGSPGVDVRDWGGHRARPAISIRMEAYDHIPSPIQYFLPCSMTVCAHFDQGLIVSNVAHS